MNYLYLTINAAALAVNIIKGRRNGWNSERKLATALTALTCVLDLAVIFDSDKDNIKD